MSKLSIPTRLIVLAGAAAISGTALPSAASAKDRVVELSAESLASETAKICLPRHMAAKDKRADLPKDKDPCLTQAEWAEHGVKLVARK